MSRRIVHPEDLGLSLAESHLSMALRRNPNFTEELLNLLDENHNKPNKTTTIYVTQSAKKQLRNACSSINNSRDIAILSLDVDWHEPLLAKNWKRYIPVHIQARRDAHILKAIERIKEHVGETNVCKTITPPTKNEEIIYVKANARKNLKLSVNTIGGKSRAGIDIDNERLKASNGETYFLVNIYGSEDATQKAIVLIQDQIGVDNYEVDIDLLDDASEVITHSVRQSIVLYVRSSVKRNLENSRRVNEIVNRSGVEDIRIKGESDFSAIPKEIKASNGINYIVVELRGTEEAIQKAIVLIKGAVGKGNVKDEIDLPPEILPAPEAPPPRTKESEAPPVEEESPKKISTLYMLRMIALFMYETVALVPKILLAVLCSMVVYVYIFIVVSKRRTLRLYQANKDNIRETLLFVPLMIFNFVYGIVKMPFDIARFTSGRVSNSVQNTVQEQQQQFEKTIYVKSSYKKKLTGKQGRKKKYLKNESGVNDIIVGSTTIIVRSMGDCVSVLLKGSENAIQNAIGMIKDTIGMANVSCEMIDQSQVEEASAAAASPKPNQENNVLEDRGNTQPSTDDASFDTSEAQEQNNASNTSNIDTDDQEEQSTTMQDDTVNEEATSVESNSTQGITTRETITTESSVPSINDRSKASKTIATVNMNETDQLLIFLQSQHQCIKGSVDEFYTWLVESEDIVSMTALKEAVSDDDYLNNRMKKGNGSSGVKGFKLEPFQRAAQEYDTKSTSYHHSLPQCQKNIVSGTQEPPDELVCPISLVLMANDPVVAADGITYERASIEDWFKKNKAKGSAIYSPVHGTEMESLILIPNIGTRNMARAFKDKNWEK